MLLMSGFVDNTMEKNAKTTGIGEVLTKPVTPELLAQAVAQVLSRASKTGAGKPFSSDAGPQA
jgi:CheY-like chemotaxis protein